MLSDRFDWLGRLRFLSTNISDNGAIQRREYGCHTPMMAANGAMRFSVSMNEEGAKSGSAWNHSQR